MKSTAKLFVAFVLSAGILGGSQALAESKTSNRSTEYDRNYNDYDDGYSRGDSYRGDRSSDRGYRNNDRGYRNSNYRDNRGRARSRVVHRQTYNTRYRARVVLVEEVYYTRSGREQLVCTVLAKGAEADYVPRRKLKKIARRGCSRYARVQYRSNYYRSNY